MKTNRMIALSILAVFLVTLLGCQKGVKTDKVSRKQGEKIEIKWLGIPNNPSAKEGTFPQKLLEEKYNIKITPIFLASNNYKEKKAMLMAGGEIPDLIYELDPADVVQDANQGLIMKLPYDTIKKYAPYIFEQITNTSPIAWTYANVDGNNYGVPNLIYTNSYSKISMWRKDWLNKVGISKIPETIDEMHAALYKFTYNDPDGNGKKDTYGMSGDIKQYNLFFTEIFGAYGVTPFNWMNVNSKPVYGGFAPGMKEALKTLSVWYKEGLIHPDFISDNAYTTGKDKFTSNIIGYMNVNGGYQDPANKNSIASILKKQNSNSEVENGKAIVGPDGKKGKFAWGIPAHIISIGKHVEKDSEKLQSILKILNDISSNEKLAADLRYGPENTCWKVMDSSKGIAGGVEWLSPYDDANKRSSECLTGDIGYPSYFAPVQPTSDVSKRYQKKEVREALDTYANPKDSLNDFFCKPDILPSSSKYFANLRTKQATLISKIIVGEKSVDDYAEFAQIWKTEGGAVLENEAANMSNNIEKIYSQVGAKN